MVFGRAAAETSIGFGTSIVPTYPRHPLVMASQALALEQLAPGRLRLGIGPSHRPVIEGMFGLGFERPLAHLREYVGILRALLHEGAVNVAGEQLTARARIRRARTRADPDRDAAAAGLPAGRGDQRRRDLLDVAAALPARSGRAGRRRGGGGAGRPAPPIVAHVPVVVSETGRRSAPPPPKQFGNYQRLPFYERMMLDAGLPDAAGERLHRRHGGRESSSPATRTRWRTGCARCRGFGVGELLADIVDTGSVETDGRARTRTLEPAGGARAGGLTAIYYVAERWQTVMLGRAY